MAAWIKHRVNDESEFSVRKDRIIATQKLTTYGVNLQQQFTLRLYLADSPGAHIVVGEKLTEQQVDELIAAIEG